MKCESTIGGPGHASGRGNGAIGAIGADRAGRPERHAGASLACVVLWIAGALLPGAEASAQQNVLLQPNAAQVFARLPAEANRPEGITTNPATGDIFVGTLEPGGSNFLLRFNRQGALMARLSTGRVPLLGLAFGEADQKVYISIPGSQIQQPSRIARVRADFGADTPLEDVARVPVLPGGRMTFPNGLAFRSGSGELFFTDSMQGAIFRLLDPSVAENICPTSAECVVTFSQSPMLRSPGAIPFGANGIAVSDDGERLFVANTGGGSLLSLPVSGDNPVVRVLGPGGIRGADGLTLVSENTVAVAASIGNEVVLLDATSGARRAVLGSNPGVANDGAPRGLSSPASVVRLGDDLLVTNLGTAGVRVPTVSRIPIPEALR